MPRVTIQRSAMDPKLLKFQTLCSSASGEVFAAQGEHETHYDIVSAHRIDGSSQCRMVQANDDPGKFEVAAKVTDVFEDGTAVVEVFGFEFWINPEQSGGLTKGMMVELSVKNLTFYV